MLQFSALRFFWCGRALRSIRADCLVGAVDILNGQPGFAMAKDLDAQGREKGISHLTGISQEFRCIGLILSAEMAGEVVTTLRSETRHSFDWLYAQADTIEKLVEKEVRDKFFLHIPPDRARFWPTAKNQNVFGDQVAAKFPSTTFEAGNAGVCLATEMPTASVFHLMRALEIGLSALGKIFGVSTAHANWQNSLDQIESKIREMPKDSKWKACPDWKEQQQYYSDCAAHFSILKDAWRNYTMHGRVIYTQDQAELILQR